MTELGIKQPAVNVTVGNVTAGSSLEDVLDAVAASILAAWNVAMSGHPVSGQVGGTSTIGNGP